MSSTPRVQIRFEASLQKALDARLEAWQRRDGTERLKAHDAALFSGADEASWMGWLEPNSEVPGLDELRHSLDVGPLTQVHTVFLLGMGGSSLGSEVIYRTFAEDVSRRLVVLDTTNPDTVGSALDTAEPDTSLVIAASKSGSTLETAALLELFWERFGKSLGESAADRFVAVTDPGSEFESRSRQRGFGHVFLGDPKIGGRFSVLSPFGLVPAVAMGLDEGKLVEPAREQAALLDGPDRENAVALGLALSTCCAAGRNKVTLVTSPGLRSFGTWLEQLLAESTGKQGKGLVPIDGEPFTAACRLGDDRVLVQLCLAGETVDLPGGLELPSTLPRIEIEVPSRYGLGGEFYRWQVATAVVGAELGINPFDQPDVESAKVATRNIVESLGSEMAEPPCTPTLYLAGGSGTSEGGAVSEALGALLAEDAASGTYFAVLAYLPMSPATRDQLQRVRKAVLESRGWATCLGFGPRYLHSTGQAHKGGPPQGRFLVLTAPSGDQRVIPGLQRKLAQVHRAQAMGDFEVLRDRGRPVVHVELRGPLDRALEELHDAVSSTL